MRRRFVAAAVAATSTAAIAASILSSTGSAAAAGHNPFGHLDRAIVSGGVVSYSGWAADPDGAGLVRITMTVDGKSVGNTIASQNRPDVGRALPSVGANRGFAGYWRFPVGKHRLCWLATNIGPGSFSTLGCIAVSVKGETTASATANTVAPIGGLEAASYANGVLSTRGWALDPDTTGPVLVDVRVNEVLVGSLTANAARPDIKARYSYSTWHCVKLTVVPKRWVEVYKKFESEKE